MGVFKWLYLLPGRFTRWFETISGATGFESGAGKLTTYLTGVTSLGERMEQSNRPDDSDDRNDSSAPG